MHEVSRETYEALEVLGEAVVREVARAMERARRLHPVFALTPAEAAAVVYNEASELVASVHDRESPDRQHAEAVDTVVTGLRFMGVEWMPRFGSERPAPAPEAVETHFDSDDDFEGVSEAPVTLYEMMEQTAQEAPDDEVNHPYSSLRKVLDDAYHQASKGKGIERHAGQDEPFDRQIICEVRRRVGPGYTKGQAVKKIYESDRLEGERGVAELLGAINYIAAEVIVRRETR